MEYRPGAPRHSRRRGRPMLHAIGHAIGRATGIALLAAMLIAPGFTAAASSPLPLYELIDARLALMQQVAAAKWLNREPIEDLRREALVVERASADARRFGVVPASSRALFQAQIDAAKEIQQYWFDRWEQHDPPRVAPGLENELRPRLLELGEQILRLAAAGPAADPARFERTVTTEGLGAAGRLALFDALARIEVYPDHLARILDSGELRIGTTGDYPPFSYRAGDREEFSGVDIDLGRDLAAALGVTPVFVPTSWPTLMEDHAQGRFDIAMSGISRTLDRQRSAFFSDPYLQDGKTPIVRCADRGRLDTLAKIDQESVRVIVNPGGTNQRFVDDNLRHAARTIHPDNRTIFREIIEGRADVMITDRIEVDMQAARHPELCAAMMDNLTFQEKAYLLPPDIHFKLFVDGWLAQRRGEGLLLRLFDRATRAEPVSR